MKSLPSKQILGIYKMFNAEIKTTNTKLKESIEAALNLLALSPNIVINNKTLDILLKSISEITENKYSKYYLSVLMILHTIVSFPEAEQKYNTILTMISLMMNPFDDNLTLKSIQILLIILNPKRFNINQATSDQILAISNNLLQTKSSHIRNSILSALQQLYHIMFEVFTITYFKNPSINLIVNTDIYKICLSHFSQQIIIHSKLGLKGINLLLQSIAADVLSMIIAEAKNTIKVLPEFLKISEQHFSKVIKEIDQISWNYSFCIRTVRMVTQICSDLNICYILYMPLLDWSKNDNGWKKLLILEGLKIISSESSEIYNLYNNMLIKQIIEFVKTTLKSYNPRTPSRGVEEKARLNLIKSEKYFEINDKTYQEYPNCSQWQITGAIIDLLCTISESMEAYAVEISIQLGNLIQFPLTNHQKEYCEMILGLFEPMTNVLFELISKVSDDFFIQHILSAIQAFIKMAGTTRQIEIAEQSILILCRLAMPNNGQAIFVEQYDNQRQEMPNRKMQISNIIFNISHSMHSLLNLPCWQHIIMLFFSIQHFISKYEYEKSGTLPLSSNISVLSKRVSENISKLEGIRISEKAGDKNQTQKEGESFENEQLPNSINNSHSLKGEEIKSEKKYLESNKKSNVAFFFLNRICEHLANPPDFVDKPLPQQFLKQPTIESDINILKSAIDSFFSITATFDYETVELMLNALGQQTMQMLESLSGYYSNQSKKVKDSFIIDKVNAFGIVRMIETALVNAHRIHQLWDFLVAHLDLLANSKHAELRIMASDALASVITCILTSFSILNNEGKIDEEHIQLPQKWSKNTWQKTIICPMLDSVFCQFGNTRKCTINNLLHLVKECGSFINEEGWSIVIKIVQRIVDTKEENLLNSAFSILSQVVNEYSNLLSIANMKEGLLVGFKFGLIKLDVNVSIMAISLMQQLADHIVIHNENNVCSNEILEFWDELLNYFRELGSDERIDIRNTSYKTIENIFIELGKHFTIDLWIKLFQEILVPLLLFNFSKAVDKFSDAFLTTPTFLQTPKFFADGGNKHNKKMVFPPNDQEKPDSSNSNQLRRAVEESFNNLLQSFARLIKKFYSLFPKSIEIINKCLISLFDISTGLFPSSSNDLVINMLKTISQIIPSFHELIKDHIERLFKIIEEITNWIGSPNFQGLNLKKPFSFRLSPSIIEFLKTIYSKELVTYCPILLENSSQYTLLLLLKKLINLSSLSEGLDGIATPYKLLIEEKLVFDFIENLPLIFINSKDFIPYINFLVEFLVFQHTNLHSEASVRQALIIIKGLISRGEIPSDIICEFLPIIFSKINNIILLRTNNEINKSHFSRNASIEPLFFEGCLAFIDVSIALIAPDSFINRQMILKTQNIEKLNQEKSSRTTETMEKEAKKDEVQIDNKILLQKLEKISMDTNLKSVLWKEVVNMVEEICNFDEHFLVTLDKFIQDKVILKIHETNTQITNFIINILLPNSESQENLIQLELIELIDKGCVSFQNITNSDIAGMSRGSGSTESLSRFCFLNMFELCQKTEIGRKENETVRKKIALIATPTLIKRCKQTISNYLKDEKRSGMMPLSSQRIHDIMFLLGKLKELDIYFNENEKVWIKRSPKGHLIELMPDLIECISSRENDIRDMIKEILKVIQKAMLENS